MKRLLLLSITFLALFGETYGQNLDIQPLSEEVSPLAKLLISHKIEICEDAWGTSLVANFGGFYTVTYIDGIKYGTQTFYQENTSEIICENCNYQLEWIGNEEMMIHVYGDAIVITGSNVQLIHID